MAKANALQIVQQVLYNLGDAQITTLNGITGAALSAFQAVNEGIYEIAFESLFQPLETATFFTVATGVTTYSKPSTIFAYDKDSFRYNEGQQNFKYKAHRWVDNKYPCQTNTNIPMVVYDWQGNFNIYPIPPISENGYLVKYRAWVIPTLFGIGAPTSTATDTATCWLPEGFDIGLLSDWATKKVLQYRHNPETQSYHIKIFGEERNDGQGDQGNLSRLKNLYNSHTIEDGNIMVEPMEQREGGWFIQESPITP